MSVKETIVGGYRVTTNLAGKDWWYVAITVPMRDESGAVFDTFTDTVGFADTEEAAETLHADTIKKATEMMAEDEKGGGPHGSFA